MHVIRRRGWELPERLVHPSPAVLDGAAEHLVLERGEPATDADVDPALGQEVEHRDVLGSHHRVPQREQHDAVPDPHPLGALGDRSHHHLGRRTVRVVAVEVVLDEPHAIEAGLVGQGDLVQRVAEDLPVGEPGEGRR